MIMGQSGTVDTSTAGSPDLPDLRFARRSGTFGAVFSEENSNSRISGSVFLIPRDKKIDKSNQDRIKETNRENGFPFGLETRSGDPADPAKTAFWRSQSGCKNLSDPADPATYGQPERLRLHGGLAAGCFNDR